MSTIFYAVGTKNLSEFQNVNEPVYLDMDPFYPSAMELLPLLGHQMRQLITGLSLDTNQLTSACVARVVSVRSVASKTCLGSTV